MTNMAKGLWLAGVSLMLVPMAVGASAQGGNGRVSEWLDRGVVAVPAQGGVYWNGEAMNSVDYNDLDEVPERVASVTATAARNAAHLAAFLSQHDYPAAPAE